MENLDDIIQENYRRLGVINTPYDPLLGTSYSDVIKRNAIHIDDAPLMDMNIPVEMEEEVVVRLLRQAGTLARASRDLWGVPQSTKSAEKRLVDLWRWFHRVRARYDYEYWCAMQIKIKLKGAGKRGYFILNRAQRYYLEQLEELRKALMPIYIELLKARQWGGSTETDFYFMWIQKMHKTNWNSTIIGDVEKQAKIILSMYESACNDYDTFIDDGEPTILKPYGRTNDVRELVGRNCTISVGSMQRPDKIRSEDISMAHLTEVGIWKTTETKTPEDVIQSIEGSILPAPYTAFVEESTAKGVGNYFHNKWLATKAGETNARPVFIPWMMIDIYSRPIVTSARFARHEYENFINSMNDYEWQLWRLGATLEAINWYRHKKRTMDEWRMMSEFPSTDIEAFQSTGRNMFNDVYLNEMYESCRPPKMVGEVVSSSNSFDKVEFLRNLRIDVKPNGHLKVWEDVDRTVQMRNRYLVTVDLGKGATDAADNTIVCVFDRFWQQAGEDGYPEVVAEWSGKESETDILAWRIAQIAAYYNNALLVIESNTIDSSKEERFRAILDEIKDFYPYIYKRAIKNTNDVGSTGSFRYGWATSHSSKEEIIKDLQWALREGTYVERCREAVDEMRIFERHEDGSLGNVKGKNNHDDRVITRALGVHFCYSSKLMQAPVLVNTEVSTTASTSLKKTIVNEMTI